MPIKTLPNVIIGSGASKNITNNIFISDFGNTIITGYLTVDYYLTVDGNLTVGGNFDLSGAITSDIIVKDGSSNTVFSVDSATGDTIVAGNFTVNGTTTTIDTTTLVVEDPVLTLAKNANGSPTASTDTGLFLQRGSTENPAIIIWNETLNQFELATVTGASSTTTNFSGVGIVKTYSSFKAGDLYGSSLDVTTLVNSASVSTSSLSIGEHTFNLNGITLGEYGNLNIHSDQSYSSIVLNWNVASGIPTTNAVIEVKRGSSTSALITWDENNDRWSFNQNLNLEANKQLKVAKPSSEATSAIVTNADVTGTPTQNMKAIEVERGDLVNSYLQWDEDNEAWDFTESLSVSGFSLTPYYIYVRYTNVSLTNGQDFYIFSSKDNGVTREILPIYSLDSIEESGVAKYYQATGAVTYSNTNPPTVNGVVYLESGKSYYIAVSSNAACVSLNEFQFYISSTVLGSAPTYTGLILVNASSTSEFTYLLTIDSTNWSANKVRDVRGAVITGTLLAASSFPYLSTLRLNNSLNHDVDILLNSDESGSGSDAKIEVERGSSTNSYIQWDDTNNSWNFNFPITVNADMNGPSNRIYGNTYIETTATNKALYVMTSSSFADTIMIASKGSIQINSDDGILLNSEQYSGIPTRDTKIEVARGSSTNSIILWDETNDRWDFNQDIYSQKIRIRTDETSGSSTRVFIYFYHGIGVLNEVIYFYIYKTSDSGLTRSVVPVSIVSTTKISAYTTNGYNAVKFTSNLSYSQHANADAFIDFEDGASYYINVYSPNSSGLAINVSFSFRYQSDVGLSANYTTVLNADMIASGGYNGLIQVNNVTPLVAQVFSAGTNISNSIDNAPALSLEYSKGIGSIVLNSGTTSTPTDASIVVDRGTSSPATLLWDESQTSWVSNQDIRLSDSTNTPDLYLEDSSSIYLVDTGSVWINDGILALESRASNTTRIYLNSELGVGDTPTTDAKITVNRGSETSAEIKWNETNDVWEITPNIKVTDFSSNVALQTDNTFVYTYKSLSLQDSLFYKIQRISSTLTNIDSDVSFVVIENGALGSAVFQPLLPDLDSDTIGGRVINIAIKNANYAEIYPATISQYIRHGGTTYSSGSPLVLSGYSSVQLVSHIVGSVKDWYVTAISNSNEISNITSSGAITIFNGRIYHCNPAGTIALTLGIAPNGTTLTFRSIVNQTTTITTASNGIEGAHNTITLNSNSEGLTIYYYGTSWWISSMYGNVGITTV